MKLNPRQCVGCGYCCKKAMCAVGQGVSVNHSLTVMDQECQFLVWHKEDDKYRCILAMDSPKYAKMILAGAGCCSPLNTWRQDVRERS